ncbi:hypothetical protein A6770_22135 [Nostoc minutum NIES-26]|uniref:Phage tail protein n=1 Tax=Nostoc minutum NIES-26 TaxID=1844469 RepID=A0A367R1G2_9NOSO|nr:hypothetical protein A6770_22135 [Nostoc minutum NIES-26]
MVLDSLLGTRVTLWLGPTVAVPAPASIVEALTSIEVTQSTEGRDGFQITFTIGRGGALGVVDYPLLANPLLRPFNRVLVQVWLGILPEVIIDGFITNYQVTPSNQPGQSSLTITGEDMRVMMDLREVTQSYPMPLVARIYIILAKYAIYLGTPPIVIPSPIPDAPPPPVGFIPAQAGTDLAYLEEQAQRCAYVFYVEPTAVPMVNLAYWGPENRLSVPQSALSVNLGAETNVESLNFQYNALSPTTVIGTVTDENTGAMIPVFTFTSSRPPLAVLPAILVQQPNVRTVMADIPEDSVVQALIGAQAMTDRSRDAVTAEGQLDVMRYGKILKARRLVGVRGAGWLLDGLYYVKRVTHSIKKGEYKQSFSLVREGFGSISPVVIP